MDSNIHPCILVSKERLTPNLLQVRFERPDGFSFIPGQFVQFLIPGDGTPMPRAYSISSIPSDSYIECCVKNAGGLGSRFFTGLRGGDEAIFRGPFGKFICTADAPSIFIAIDAGIAPLMSILRSLLEDRGSEHKLQLLFGVSREQELFWNSRLLELRRKYPNFSYRVAYARSGQTSEWAELSAYVDGFLKKERTYVYYLCGDPAVVVPTRQQLLDAGILPERILFEVF